MLSLAGVATLVALAGCQMDGPSGPRAVAPQGGVEGEWVDAQGVAVSRFSGGGFETVALDTGNRLAEGSYRYRDRRTVEISMTSLIRQTQLSVNCALVAPTQLNCTNSEGQQFVLTRRAAV
uniref:hypothetical protein n=1 Tax=Aquibium sp. A9E412 TaxID=2976767 RepID=UPI00339D749E